MVQLLIKCELRRNLTNEFYVTKFPKSKLPFFQLLIIVRKIFRSRLKQINFVPLLIYLRLSKIVDLPFAFSPSRSRVCMLSQMCDHKSNLIFLPFCRFSETYTYWKLGKISLTFLGIQQE
jgi:hypothetical protein